MVIERASTTEGYRSSSSAKSGLSKVFQRRVPVEPAPRHDRRDIRFTTYQQPQNGGHKPTKAAGLRNAISAPPPNKPAVGTLPKINNLISKSILRSTQAAGGKPIAGVPSKSIEPDGTKSNKFATTWAAARVGEAIPNLRNTKVTGDDDGHSVTTHKTSESKLSKHSSLEDNSIPDRSKGPSKAKGRSRAEFKSVSDTSQKEEQMASPTEKNGKNSDQSKHRPRKEQDKRNSLDPSPSKPKATSSQKTSDSAGISNKSQKVQQKPSYMSNPIRIPNASDRTWSASTTSTAIPMYSQLETVHEQTRMEKRAAKQAAIADKWPSLAAYMKPETTKVKKASTVNQHTPEPQPKKRRFLNKNEAKKYIDFRSLYVEDAEKSKEKRLKKFFNKLEDVQLQTSLAHNQEVVQQAEKKKQSQIRQAEQLKRLREKFEDDRHRRLRNQYVTKNIVDYEKQNRKNFGLPEHFEVRKESGVKEGELTTYETFKEKRTHLKKRYSGIFKIKTGSTWNPRTKTPKMDGVDTISLHEEEIIKEEKPTAAKPPQEVKKKKRKSKAKPVEVKQVIEEARELLLDIPEPAREPSRGSDISKTRQTPISLEDEEDIIERLRLKYNIDFSEDEDDL